MANYVTSRQIRIFSTFFATYASKCQISHRFLTISKKEIHWNYLNKLSRREGKNGHFFKRGEKRDKNRIVVIGLNSVYNSTFLKWIKFMIKIMKWIKMKMGNEPEEKMYIFGGK